MLLFTMTVKADTLHKLLTCTLHVHQRTSMPGNSDPPVAAKVDAVRNAHMDRCHLQDGWCYKLYLCGLV